MESNKANPFIGLALLLVSYSVSFALLVAISCHFIPDDKEPNMTIIQIRKAIKESNELAK